MSEETNSRVQAELDEEEIQNNQSFSMEDEELNEEEKIEDPNEDDDDDDDDDDDEDDSETDDDESIEQDEAATAEDDANNEQEMLDDDEYDSKMKELESNLVQNQFNYQTYIDILKLAKENADLNKLREYREKMSELFPLTENLWLDWLRDEQKMALNDADRIRINGLFNKALNDYLSIELWLEYIQFSIGDMGKPNGVEQIRAICEKAIGFAGLHVANGCLLWEAYREFESAMLSGLEASFAATIQTEQQKNQLNEQIERIVSIFRRQLGVCLNNVKSTFAEFEQFDDKYIDESTRKIYEKSLKKYQQIEQFELKLVDSTTDEQQKLVEFKNYLGFELKQLNSLYKPLVGHKGKQNNIKIENEIVDADELNLQRSRLKCLFERAIAANSNCLDVALWEKYIYYLNDEESINPSADLNEFSLNVAKRSIRNCPWSSKLWINYTFCLEKSTYLNQTESIDLIKGAFNQALNSGLQTSEDYLNVWHHYLDFLRRISCAKKTNDELNEEQVEELRDAFQKAINQLFDFFKHKGDPTYSLEKYWALVEAKYLKNMEKSRKIFNEMILAKTDASQYAQIWLEFYDLEKEFGDEKHQRKLLNRALNEVNAQEKEAIFDVLLKFEKLNGNAQQHANVYFKYEHFKEACQLEAAAKKKKPEPVSNKKEANKPQHGKGDFQKKPQPTKEFNKAAGQGEKPANGLKRKLPESNDADAEKNSKKTVNLKDKDGFAIPSLPFSAPVPAAAVEKPKTNEPVPKTIEQYKQFSELTVFISNLSFDIDEVKLKNVFEKQQGFKEIRLVRNWGGKSKGYGYVDFETAEQAKDALKLDRSLIDGRPVFVSKNEDKSLDFGQNKLKYATNLEKNKLFISGLPFSMDKSGLEEIMAKFGKVKEVRIVTYKNGKSKGLAYAEFEDEQSASKALLQTDGMLIGENQIAVAISNPPKRKDSSSFGSSNESTSKQKASSLGSGSYKTASSTPNSVSSSTLSSIASFVPRSQVVGRKKTLSLDLKK